MFRTRLLARASTASSLVRTQQRRALACSCLYVRGLPLDTDADRLRKLFEGYGPIYDTNLLANRAGDRYSIGFVRYYAGELPTTVDELARLPMPDEAEVEQVRSCSQNAIDAMAGTEVDGCTLDVQYASRNNADHIQFQGRLQQRRERDPTWASQRSSPGGSSSNASGGYADGYKAGFRDGVAEGRTRS
ncbi:hypothetical protein LPJ61_003827 [Coemansia biformis]|uniref:RRM domain-containing protein n=1 Tax=Coemansia biformis TaxID=1286918 RepID=A0A9W7Y5X0_9FUNG|nr:hypothetical protein LPJ61_003827 [Coemansia biformis]